MNTRSTLDNLTRSFAAVPSLRLPVLAAAGLLSWGNRRRSRRQQTLNSVYLVTAGLVVGAGAALLLSPESGKDVRTRMGKLFGGGVGKLVGGQIGAHPVGTARAVNTARELLGQKEG